MDFPVGSVYNLGVHPGVGQVVSLNLKTQVRSPPNEDLVWANEEGAVVLDGTSGLADRTFTDCESDGQWYVQTLSEAIKKRIYDKSTLSNVVATAIEHVDEQMIDLIGNANPATHELPAAAGVVLRWRDNVLEYFILGDCTLLIESQDGLQPIVGEGPRQLDQRVVDQMVTLRQQNKDLDHRELRNRVQPLLVSHRKLQNQPDGYWAFGFDTEAVEYAETGHVSRNQLEYIVAFTDGFEPLYTQYDVFAEWKDLVSYLKHNGLSRAIRLLRAFEATDPECETYPRLKPADDVGLVTLDFQQEG